MKLLAIIVLFTIIAVPASALDFELLASDSISSSSDDGQSKAWGKMVPFIYEIDFSLLSLASLAEWGPPTNGYISGFFSVVILGSSGMNLIFNPDPDVKWKSLPGVISGLLCGYLSYYCFNQLSSNASPGTRAWTTFLGYNLAMAPLLVQITIFSYS